MKTLEELEKELAIQKEKINNSLIDLKVIEDEIILLKDKGVDNKVKSVYRLEKYQKYHYIGMNFRKLIVDEDKDAHHTSDDNSYNQNNYFHTKEEAERYLSHLLLQLELLRLRDKLNGKFDHNNTIVLKYAIYYSITDSKLKFIHSRNCIESSLFFKSESVMREFINIVGEDKIIQYLTF